MHPAATTGAAAASARAAGVGLLCKEREKQQQRQKLRRSALGASSKTLNLLREVSQRISYLSHVVDANAQALDGMRDLCDMATDTLRLREDTVTQIRRRIDTLDQRAEWLRKTLPQYVPRCKCVQECTSCTSHEAPDTVGHLANAYPDAEEVPSPQPSGALAPVSTPELPSYGSDA